MDRIEELLQKMVRVGNAGEITIRAERHRATFEQGYTDPKEALECYQELKRNRWVLTELRIEYMPPRRSVIQEITDKKIGRIIDDFEARMRRERESKKMLNVEKYLTTIKEEIAKDACASKSCLIAKVRGDERPDCNDRTCRDCSDESLDWLFSEHEPPLLKNGDGLKPGDWIMVKDADETKWAKKRFLTFADGWFHCFKNGKDYFELEGEFICYKQARLPKEGE